MDTWTTKQMVYSFACTIGSFISEDWELISYVVDFTPLQDKQHEGLHAGKAFADGAHERGCLDKICRIWPLLYCLTFLRSVYFSALTTDNASVNDVLVKTTGRFILTRYGIPWTPDMHIRCIAHVVNLVVQAFLAAIDEADDPDEVDYYKLNKGNPIHYNVEEDEEQIALEAEVVDPTLNIPPTKDFELEDEERNICAESPLKWVCP